MVCWLHLALESQNSLWFFRKKKTEERRPSTKTVFVLVCLFLEFASKRLNLPRSILVWSWRPEEMGQPGKVSKDESPVLGVSPNHPSARRTQLPGSLGSPEQSQKLRGAPRKGWFLWGPPRVLVFHTDMFLSTDITRTAHPASLGFCLAHD